MSDRVFDIAAFYKHVGATAKEQHALRQDIVRGLKDYYEAAYGYDRYGAETVFRIPERLGEPYIYGFALLRVLRDRRVSDEVKAEAARIAIEMIDYGQDGGIPYGIMDGVRLLARLEQLDLDDLRYVMVATAGEFNPFRGLEKSEILDLFVYLLGFNDLPPVERSFWSHTLIARHQDRAGAGEMIDRLLGNDLLPVDDRKELCQAWINFRQPRLLVPIPEDTGGAWGLFIQDHMPFWVTHAPSWPSHTMARHALVWSARLGEDPLELARTYLGYRDAYAEQFHSGVADIIAEHHGHMAEQDVKTLIERGISVSGSIPTRRRFYRLGMELFGSEYLRRATTDTANSVRQWAARQLQKQG